VVIKKSSVKNSQLSSRVPKWMVKQELSSARRAECEFSWQLGCAEKTLHGCSTVIFEVYNSVRLIIPIARKRIRETVIEWGH
jgi:hypothetical protein